MRALSSMRTHEALPRQQAGLRGLLAEAALLSDAPARKILRSVHEGARDVAREIAKTEAYATSRRQRKKVEMLFAHLKRILSSDRLRLRGTKRRSRRVPPRRHRQNLRKLAKLDPSTGANPGNLRGGALIRRRDQTPHSFAFTQKPTSSTESPHSCRS